MGEIIGRLRWEPAKPPEEIPFDLDKLAGIRKELKPFRAELGKVVDTLAKSGVKFKVMSDRGDYLKGEAGEYDITATLEYDDEIMPKPIVMVKVFNLNHMEPIDPAWGAMVNKKGHSVYTNKLIDYAVGQAPGKRDEVEGLEEEP